MLIFYVAVLGTSNGPVVDCPELFCGFEDELWWIGGTTATFDGEGTCHLGSGRGCNSTLMAMQSYSFRGWYEVIHPNRVVIIKGWVCWQRVTRGGPTHQFPSDHRCHLRRRGVFSWKWGGTSDDNKTETVGRKCNELIDCAMWQGVQAPLHLQYQQQAQLLWLKKWGCRCGQFFAVAEPASRMNISCNTEVVLTKYYWNPKKIQGLESVVFLRYDEMLTGLPR